MDVSAEFHKLLIYEEGGFFSRHRDTEKTAGMFGTLTIVLPSAFHGGEPVIRHTGREATVDLSSAETSELTFAAFYADCKHEVKPIKQGSRVCLIYNLWQSKTRRNKPITPLYESEADRAGAILKRTFQKSEAPAKLAWLLEHQYSPAGLSFSRLKGRDAGLAKVLQDPAGQAECALHVGIVHIEESGAAEAYFDEDYGYAPCYEGESETCDDEFEVIEVDDRSRHINQWIDTNDHPVEFGSRRLRAARTAKSTTSEAEAGWRTLVVARKILELLGRPESSLKFVMHRPAHDRWYALDCAKLKDSLGWEPRWKFEDGLADTIRWY